MNDDLISGIFYFLEFLNPPPLLEMELQEIQGMISLCVMLLTGFGIHALLRDSKTLPDKESKVIAICMALMGGIFVPKDTLVTIAMVYAAWARALDGLFVGFALGELIRKMRGKMHSVAPVYLLGENFAFIFSIASLILAGRTCVRVFKTAPIMREQPRFAVILAVTCVAGLVAVPSIDNHAFKVLFLGLFPSFACLGIFAGLKISRDSMESFFS